MHGKILTLCKILYRMDLSECITVASCRSCSAVMKLRYCPTNINFLWQVVCILLIAQLSEKETRSQRFPVLHKQINGTKNTRHHTGFSAQPARTHKHVTRVGHFMESLFLKEHLMLEITSSKKTASPNTLVLSFSKVGHGMQMGGVYSDLLPGRTS